MFGNSEKKLAQATKKTGSILGVFQKAKDELVQNIAEYEQIEAEVVADIQKQQELLSEVVTSTNSAKTALTKFTELLGE